MTAYLIVVTLHSYLRWVVLGLLGVLCAVSARGLRSGAAWSPRDERIHIAAVAALDAQLTLGLLLYLWLSPYVHAFFATPGAGMKDAILRFFGVEHVFAMLIVVAIVHVARVRSKRASDSRTRHRRVFWSTLVALIVLAIAIPWPFLRYGRPLLRGLT